MHACATPEPTDADVAPISRSISFLHWTVPIVIIWAAVCLIAAAAHDFSEVSLETLAYLSPVYAVLYLIRVNTFLLTKSFHEIFVVSFMVFFVSFPFLYFFSHLSMWLFSYFDQRMYMTTRRLIEFFLDINIYGDIARFTILSFVFIPFFAFLFSFIVIAIEKLAMKSSAGKIHFVGLFLSGLLSLVLIFDRFSLLVLVFLPLPHLFFVWFFWLRAGGIGQSPFAARRALVAAVGVVALVYSVGIVRSVPDQGWGSIVWPLLIRHYEAQVDFDYARQMLVQRPRGYGSVPIGGRSYLISADFDAYTVPNWEAPGEFWSVHVQVPYAGWIDGFEPSDREPVGNAPRLETAEIRLSVDASDVTRNGSVACTPDRVHGLRQCFRGNRGSWLDIDADTLEPIGLHTSHGLSHWVTERREIVALEDRGRGEASTQAGSDTVQGPAFVARCAGWSPAEQGASPPEPNARWRDSCYFYFITEGGYAEVEIHARMLPYWRQLQAGAQGSVAEWAAAAQDAEPIDVVAERLATSHARQVAQQPADISPWCQPDRFLVAAIGIEWEISMGFKNPTEHGYSVRQFCQGPTRQALTF